MRVAAIQFDIVWEKKPANHAIVERMLDDAKVPRGTYVLLPELGDTGFSFNLDRIVDDQSLAWGRRVARERGIILQVGHAERGSDRKGRNCATVIDATGDIAGQYQKVHPFSYGKEIEHFSGGDHLLLVDVEGDNERTRDGAVCPLICYDLRFPELWRIATRHGAKVFAIGASWPAPRQHHWRSLLMARAIENQAYVVGVNRTGADPHLEYRGGSLIVSPTGEILAEGGEKPCVLQAELDMPALHAWRQTFPALRDIRSNLLGGSPLRRAVAAGK